MPLTRLPSAMLAVLIVLAGCSPSVESSTDGGDAASWTLQQAMLNCLPFDQQVALSDGCVCGATATTFDCLATLQTCDGRRFWTVALPVETSCVHGADGALVSARICSNAHGCQQAGPEMQPPASCAPARSLCAGDGGATD